MENELKLYDRVKLKYTQEDLEDEDLGMSGIVLKSPLRAFKDRLNDHYMFRGHMKENDIHGFVSIWLSDGTRLDRLYPIQVRYLEKVPEPEYDVWDDY